MHKIEAGSGWQAGKVGTLACYFNTQNFLCCGHFGPNQFTRKHRVLQSITGRCTEPRQHLCPRVVNDIGERFFEWVIIRAAKTPVFVSSPTFGVLEFATHRSHLSANVTESL